MRVDVSEIENGVRFAVRVQPRAQRNALPGTLGGALKVQLTTPPLEGRANAALVGFLAERFRVSRSAVRVLAGERSRNKIVEVLGVRRSDVDALVVMQEE